MPNMTLEEFKKLCESHDWYYDRSDHYATYLKGRGERETIRAIAYDLGGEYLDMYNDYRKKAGELIW